MSQAFGDNSWIGFGVESTFGTAVARTVFTEFLSEGIKLDQGREARPSLRGRSRNRRGQKKKAVGGPLEMQVQINGMEVLFKHALGSNSTGGSGPYTHTMSLSRALPTGLSVEVNRDASNIGGSSSFLYDGCQIAKMTLSHEAGDFLKASFDIVGEGDASLVAVSTPTFATFDGFDWTGFACYYDSPGVIDPGGTGVLIELKSLDELTIDNNLATDRYNLGTNKRKGFGPNGPRMISGKFTVEFASTTELVLFRNQTASSLVFKWTSSTNSLQINLLKVEFIEGEPSVTEAGPITLQMSFEAYINSAEGDEMALILINSTATVP